jgi:hypothetical protein
MFAPRTISRHWPRALLALSFGCWCLENSAEAGAQDRVIRRTDRDGRVVYTNIDDVSVGGVPVQSLALPELIKLDLTDVPRDMLPKIHERITQVHHDVQTGEQCEGIRSAARGSARARLLHDHRRELFTALGLLVFAWVATWGWPGRTMRILMGLPPLAGALLLGSAALQRSGATSEALYAGLRACSADLPEVDPARPEGVAQSLGSVVSQITAIQRVLKRRDEGAPSIPQ